MARRLIVLDACVAINLAATDSFEQIADTLKVTFVMAAPAAVETGYLRDVEDGRAVSTPIDLARLQAAGVLQIVQLQPEELAQYIELAAIVDDGEAATIAVSARRGLEMATDDRRARRLCHERNLPEPLRTTSLLRQYADNVHLTAGQIRGVIARMRDRASFQPARTDPELKWWQENADETDTKNPQ